MLKVLEYGLQIIEAFLDVGDSLTTTFEVPWLGSVSILGLILGSVGGGLFVLFTYRIIKWFADIVL